MSQLTQLSGKTYCIKTFGCQMNMHDSERVSGLLESHGCILVSSPQEADIVVYMTCCVRENADNRLYGQVTSLISAPPAPSGRRVVCIGGCIAQRDGETIRKHMPNVNVVFGTQAISRMPQLVQECFESSSNELYFDTLEDYSGFSTDLPSNRADKYHAWVPIMTGCNNFCTYCIVPHVRGREVSRMLESIVEEVIQLKNEGVREVTLLGQNVNSYGKNIYRKPSFALLLSEVAKTGIERIRFTSSNPHDLDDDIIEAMAQYKNIMPHLHFALQSGSNTVLKAMNRRYTAEQYVERVEKLKKAIPGISLTTDIIVGFPGETEQDFQDTIDMVNTCNFNSCFTFIYSPREGTPACTFEQNATQEEIQNRFDRLVEVVQDNAFRANQQEIESLAEVLIEGTSKKDSGILVGHSEKNTTVHAPLPAHLTIEDVVGKILTIKIKDAKTWYLSGDVVGDPH